MRELRTARRMTVEELAEKAGLSHSHVSRIENGRRGLSREMAHRLASALNSTVAEVMGLSIGSGTSKPRGLSEDAVPLSESDTGHPVPKMGPNTDPWIVRTDALSNLGIDQGSIIYVDISATALENLKPLQCVVAQVYDDHDLLKATTIIRQFVPPSLLITNSAGTNDRVRDLMKGEADIKGVIVGNYRPMAA